MNTKILVRLKSHLLKDQIGRPVLLTHPPQRIICLVPSITELLFDLGLGNRVVGITKFCIHPAEWFLTKERIGGTKNVNIKKINTLKPDFIIANKEENVKEQVEELAQYFPVYTSDIHDLQTALQMILDIGQLTRTERKATAMHKKIMLSFSGLKPIPETKKIAYLIWKDPYITVGGDTFIQDIIQRAGWENLYKHKKRYPEVDLIALQKKKPDLIFLSSEPFPFKEKHMAILAQYFPKATIILVDGSMFSWYGSRIIQTPKYLKQLQLLINSAAVACKAGRHANIKL